MTEPRQLAVIRGLDDVLAAFRAQAAAKELSRTTLDILAGFTPGLSAKYLAEPQIRTYSLASAIAQAASIGLAFTLIEHEQSMQQPVFKRARKRQTNAVRANGVASMFNRKAARRIIGHFGRIGGIKRAEQTEGESTLAKIAVKGGKARKRSLSRKRRREIAFEAAVIRWERVRAAVQINESANVVRCQVPKPPSSYAHGNPQAAALARPAQTTSNPRQAEPHGNSPPQAQATPRPRAEPTNR
jgi:hypothetical protein